MDRALAYHLSAACKDLVSATRKHMLPLLHELDHNPDAADVAARVRWPDDEPALVFCARHTELRDLALRLVPTELAGVNAVSKDGLTALHLGADALAQLRHWRLEQHDVSLQAARKRVEQLLKCQFVGDHLDAMQIHLGEDRVGVRRPLAHDQAHVGRLQRPK